MIKIKFIAEKTTKNTVLYKEQAQDGPAVVGSLYVQKQAAKEMAPVGQEFPEYLYVTIEAG